MSTSPSGGLWRTDKWICPPWWFFWLSAVLSESLVVFLYCLLPLFLSNLPLISFFALLMHERAHSFNHIRSYSSRCYVIAVTFFAIAICPVVLFFRKNNFICLVYPCHVLLDALRW